jgi:hypothetical protein
LWAVVRLQTQWGLLSAYLSGNLPSLASDAYATGQALVALKEAGAVDVSSPSYKRGIEFLLKTQLEDGSGYVKSRANPIQPYFESGFPHGRDQWISAGASNWATAMALVLASQKSESYRMPDVGNSARFGD